jgi:hypothetical protein
LIAALLAVYLGAFGPRFRWRGASLLAGASVAIGLVATALAARAAAEQGLRFAVTPTSVLQGLILQAVFMLTFYGMAALAGWSARQLAPAKAEAAPRDTAA